MRYITLCGTDNRMDCRDLDFDPLNALPIKCEVCSRPDYEHVPQPYYLVRSRTLTPVELNPAENGNLLVRDRVKNILEVVVPGELSFYPTQYNRSTEETPWWLAVPVHDMATERMKAGIPHCPACGFPMPPDRSNKSRWQPPTEPVEEFIPTHDVFKSKWWTYRPLPWPQLHMSVRMLNLLRELQAKGLHEQTSLKPESDTPTLEEKAWVAGHLKRLVEHGISMNAPGTIAVEDAKWFREFLKRNPVKFSTSSDTKAFEKRSKLRLPKSYKDFLSKLGTMSFENVDEIEGFSVRILSPEEFDVESYRAGRIEAGDAENNSIDGIMFAETDHGDCFCFDVRKDRKEFEVYLYQHDLNSFEHYASDFAACLRRFASGLR